MPAYTKCLNFRKCGSSLIFVIEGYEKMAMESIGLLTIILSSSKKSTKRPHLPNAFWIVRLLPSQSESITVPSSPYWCKIVRPSGDRMLPGNPNLDHLTLPSFASSAYKLSQKIVLLSALNPRSRSDG